MTPFKEEWVKEALVKAYGSEEACTIPKSWTDGVMSRIRAIGPLCARPPFLSQFEQFLWGLAPLACVLIVVLIIYMIKVDCVPEHELARLLIDDPIGFMAIGSAII